MRTHINCSVLQRKALDGLEGDEKRWREGDGVIDGIR